MDIREIAERLQQDQIEGSEKPKKIRPGSEVEFIQTTLGDSGYRLPIERIRTIASEASSYENFIFAATKKRT
jgi:hypothetical protein